MFLLPVQKVRSEKIFLKCTGKFEINRGELIKPDWETNYLTINSHGLKSTIIDKGIAKEGRTLVKGNSYTITQRENNIIKNIYKVHRILNTYTVYSPERNRTLIGTCQKSRG
tara:strand:- start:291 stop:626 length:336 start_codon:yes stop_codon:yes gene_type:complete